MTRRGGTGQDLPAPAALVRRPASRRGLYPLRHPWSAAQGRHHADQADLADPRHPHPHPGTLTRDPAALEREAQRRAAYILGTTLLDGEAWLDEAVIALYREQRVAERGVAFLKDLLFPESSVFVKRPDRIMALAFIMTLCLLVYQLTEGHMRQQLAAVGRNGADRAQSRAQADGAPDATLAVPVL